MTTALDITQAQTSLQNAALKVPTQAANVAAAKKAAQSFESVFISEFLGSMFQDMPTDGYFDGGPGEAMFRSMMLDEYGKEITKQGGFGLSSIVTKQLLQHQEIKNPSAGAGQ